MAAVAAEDDMEGDQKDDQGQGGTDGSFTDDVSTTRQRFLLTRRFLGETVAMTKADRMSERRKHMKATRRLS